jgi:hypothetical protein
MLGNMSIQVFKFFLTENVSEQIYQIFGTEKANDEDLLFICEKEYIDFTRAYYKAALPVP